MCKAGISREKVVPLYGRGSQKPQDPRLKTPPRPQGQRPAPESRGVSRPSLSSRVPLVPRPVGDPELPCLPRDSSRSATPAASTSRSALVLFPSASSPPCSTPTSLSGGEQVGVALGCCQGPLLAYKHTFEAFLFPTGVDLGQGHAASSWQDSLFLFLAIFFFFWLLSV